MLKTMLKACWKFQCVLKILRCVENHFENVKNVYTNDVESGKLCWSTEKKLLH